MATYYTVHEYKLYSRDITRSEWSPFDIAEHDTKDGAIELAELYMANEYDQTGDYGYQSDYFVLLKHDGDTETPEQVTLNWYAENVPNPLREHGTW